MKPILRNSLAVVAGLVVGSAVNMGLILISGSVIPPPEGADTTSMEGLEASLHLFEPKHFLFPFLAHALGTLVGAFTAALLAGSNKCLMAMIIGFLFLTGGVTNAFLLPAPAWFITLDLLVAYLPMAWLGCKLAGGGQTQPAGVIKTE